MSLTKLRLAIPRSKYRYIWFLVRAHFLIDGCLLMMSSCSSSVGTLWGCFWTLIPSMRALSSWPTHLLKLSLFSTITLGVRFQNFNVNFGETQTYKSYTHINRSRHRNNTETNKILLLNILLFSTAERLQFNFPLKWFIGVIHSHPMHLNPRPFSVKLVTQHIQRSISSECSICFIHKT